MMAVQAIIRNDGRRSGRSSRACSAVRCDGERTMHIRMFDAQCQLVLVLASAALQMAPVGVVCWTYVAPMFARAHLDGTSTSGLAGDTLDLQCSDHGDELGLPRLGSGTVLILGIGQVPAETLAAFAWARTLGGLGTGAL